MIIKLNCRVEKNFCGCGCETEIKPGQAWVKGHNKGKFKPKSGPQLCACNCGEYTNPGRKFINGHSRRNRKNSLEHNKKVSLSNKGKTPHNKGKGKPISPPQLCECGICGLMTKPGRKFVKGHATKNMKLSEEHIRKISFALQGEKSLLFGKPSWNAGLTKETDKRLAKQGETYKSNGNVSWIKGLTKETDERIAKYGRKISRALKLQSDLLSENARKMWKEPGHKENFHNVMSGVNHPYYRERIGFTPDMLERDYPIEFGIYLKQEIRDRDGRICRNCGRTEFENGMRLDVHHIDYDKNNCDGDNLISLCHSCHAKTNMFNREEWKCHFANLMKQYAFVRKQQNILRYEESTAS